MSQWRPPNICISEHPSAYDEGTAVIFQRTDPPARHRQHPINRHAKWYTWSPEALAFVHDHARELRRLQQPTLVNIKGCEPYEASYDIHPDRLASLDRRRLDALARSLVSIGVGSRLMLLTGMRRREVDSALMYVLFAILRTAIVTSTRNPKRALFTPVKAVRSDDGFPLHADLFINERLLLIFDDVPEDQSGKTLLLPTTALFKMLAGLPQMPASSRRQVERLLTGPLKKDGFDTLYSLLHGPHPWRADLQAALTKHQVAIKFRPGEGYLLNDRHWLHGRTAASGPVRARRFRRLVF
jgi:hypothetical protein